MSTPGPKQQHVVLTFLLVTLLAILLSSVPANSAVMVWGNYLQHENYDEDSPGGWYQQLHGVNGLEVNGDIYSVRFRDRSCAELFDGCDESSDFDFDDLQDVRDAYEALSQFVFGGYPLGYEGRDEYYVKRLWYQEVDCEALGVDCDTP